MYVYNPKRNVNYRRRNKMAPGGPRLSGPHFTSSELMVPAVNRQLREDELEVREIRERKHMEEVREWVPYLRECKRKGKDPRRVPKRILDTVEALKLV